MAALGALAGNLLAPAVAPVVQSVLGSIVGAGAQGMLQAASGVVGGYGQAVSGVTGGVQTLLGGIQEAFGKLFGQQHRHPHLTTCPHRPPCCGTNQIPGNIWQNPLKFLQGLQNVFQQMGGMLQNLTQQFPGLLPGIGFNSPFAPSFPGGGGVPGGGGIGGGGFPGGGVGSVGGGGDFKFLDRMQDQIQNLMQSENPSDQIKAQQLMNQLNRIVDSIMSILSKERDIQKRVAENMAR